MPRALSHCPVCESSLEISELACTRCGTEIHGHFESCRFCRLSPEHIAFLETFLRCEGNLSRVERQLAVSYPTVRNRFTAVLTALGFAGGEDQLPTEPVRTSQPEHGVEAAARRRDILDALANGTITADEAAAALRGFV